VIRPPELWGDGKGVKKRRATMGINKKRGKKGEDGDGDGDGDGKEGDEEIGDDSQNYELMEGVRAIHEPETTEGERGEEDDVAVNLGEAQEDEATISQIFGV
jgi:hypothetical protein